MINFGHAAEAILQKMECRIGEKNVSHAFVSGYVMPVPAETYDREMNFNRQGFFHVYQLRDLLGLESGKHYYVMGKGGMAKKDALLTGSEVCDILKQFGIWEGEHFTYESRVSKTAPCLFGDAALVIILTKAVIPILMLLAVL